MPYPVPFPPRLPQRVVVAAAPGPTVAAALDRLARVLDVPLLLASDLGPGDAARLAAFDGWIASVEDTLTRVDLLPRADLVLHLQAEPAGTLRGLVRRTVRRIRADAVPEPDLSWVETVPATFPDLPLVQLTGPDQVAAWLGDLERSLGLSA